MLRGTKVPEVPADIAAQLLELLCVVWLAWVGIIAVSEFQFIMLCSILCDTLPNDLKFQF